MTELALEYGYVGLFFVSLIASTLIAAPADVMAMAMPQFGFNPVWIVVVAVMGGYLGNLVNYSIGRYGANFFLSRYPSEGQSGKWYARAEKIYERYGIWSLLLSGMPFIGDPLTAIAGVFHVNWIVFTVLVIIGKVAKLLFLLTAADTVVGWF